MKLGGVLFRINDSVPNTSRRYWGSARVMFTYDQRGKPLTVRVAIGTRDWHEIDNSKGTYKACATHAQELVRQLLKPWEKPPGEFAKHRLKEQRPALKLVGEND